MKIGQLTSQELKAIIVPDAGDIAVPDVLQADEFKTELKKVEVHYAI